MTCFFAKNKDDCPTLRTEDASICYHLKSTRFNKPCVIEGCEHFLDANPPDVPPIAGCLGGFLFALLIVGGLWYLVLCGMGIL